jgi:hypothetical protein
MRPILILPACALGIALAVAVMPLTAAAGGGVSVRFDLSDPSGSPFPSDRFTVRDWNNLTQRRVDLPKPDCTVQVSDCEDLDLVNTLDGFSTQPRITVPFTGAIDPASVNSRTIYLVNLGDTLSGRGFGQRVGINQVVWDPATLTLAFESDELLAQHSRYLLLVTDGVKDAAGQPIEPGAFGSSLERPAGMGPAAEFQRELRDALRLQRDAGHRVIAASLFTTQTITADLEKIARRIKQSQPAPVDFMIGRDVAGAPARTVFPVATLTSILFTRQTGTAPTFAAPAPAPLSLLNLVPGALGQVAYGNFSSPDYLTDAFIPPTGTLSGEPQVQRINRLLFVLYLPAGPRPAAGWPVTIFGHGGGPTTLHAGSQWRVASTLASHGIAMIATHMVGFGGGPLGTLRVQRTDGPDLVLGAGGRSADVDGNGIIGDDEGNVPPAPRLTLGNRDAQRQSAVDAIQLVRQIELGIDADGDGRPDLDASRISWLGQSGGTINGSMVLAFDPSVRLGVLNVAGGSITEQFRYSPGARVAVLGRSIAARVPSLINVGGPSGLEFNENMPLRNLPPVINTVPGAMALARMLDQREWVQQAGNSVSYAPYLRAQPLPGQPPKLVLLQFAKGERTTPNPMNMAFVRAGDLADRSTMYRHDLAFAANPALPKDAHAFLTSGIVTSGWTDIVLKAQRQIAVFLASDGATIIDPDGDGALYEVPIPLPLPETLDFIP